MTAPHVGNTGLNDEDPESSRIWVAGYVVRDPARVPSSWRSRRSLDDGAPRPGRRRHLRHRHPRADPPPARAGRDAGRASRRPRPTRRRCSPGCASSAEMAGANLSAEVSTTEPYVVPAVGERRFTVAALDLGIKANTPADDGRARRRDPRAAGHRDARRRARGRAGRAVLLQRPRRPGGDHRAGRAAARRARRRGIPYFGICFGNQLFGRALGFDTYKLTYGHRGINQPVLDRTTGKVEVTAHNHGFAVRAPARRGHAARRTARRRSATSASTTTSSRGSSSATTTAG